MEPKPLNVICFATFFKGAEFMRECKALGCNVILITKEKMLKEDWPREALAEVHAVPHDAPVELFLDLVSHFAKTANRSDHRLKISCSHRGARARASVSGWISSSAAKTFRDKLAMSVLARRRRESECRLRAAIIAPTSASI